MKENGIEEQIDVLMTYDSRSEDARPKGKGNESKEEYIKGEIK